MTVQVIINKQNVVQANVQYPKPIDVDLTKKGRDGSDGVDGKDDLTKGYFVPTPDLQFLQTPALMFFYVSPLQFPNGIEITSVHLAISTQAAYSITLQDWDSPDDGTPRDIVAVATGASENNISASPSGTDGEVAAGNYIMLALPNTDIDWTFVQFEYILQTP